MFDDRQLQCESYRDHLKASAVKMATLFVDLTRCMNLGIGF